MDNNSLKDLKILFVEDEDIIRDKTVSSLKYIVSEVISASNGEIALEELKSFTPHIIITDLEMPLMNGVDFIHKIRESDKEICIIVVTAYTSEKYLLQLIDMHIEKYIIKPITLDKLISALENCQYTLIKKDLPHGYKYDWNQKLLVHDKTTISLTKKEILFLELLFKNINTITYFDELQRVVWQESVMTDNALRSLIRNLRRKLPEDFIINLSGIGYKIA